MTQENRKRRTRITPAAPGTSISKRKDQKELSREFDDVFTEFRRSFDDLLSPFFPLATDIEQEMKLPIRYSPVDFVDNGNSYTITAELPGFTKDMVEVEVTAEGASIKAECKEQKEEKDKTYLHRERAYSALQRYIAFPEEVAASKVEGSMKDGILKLEIPKLEPKPEDKPHKVDLK